MEAWETRGQGDKETRFNPERHSIRFHLSLCRCEKPFPQQFTNACNECLCGGWVEASKRWWVVNYEDELPHSSVSASRMFYSLFWNTGWGLIGICGAWFITDSYVLLAGAGLAGFGLGKWLLERYQWLSGGWE